MRDASIRVSDSRGLGEETSQWTLYREDGVWRVAVKCWDGQEFDTAAPTAEDVRGHVYWHIMNEFETNPENNAFALKVSSYAADIFTAVETELARYREQ